MSATIRVRIAVSVAPSGEWNSSGWRSPGTDPRTDEELAETADDVMPRGSVIHFIEADIPLPVPQTIEAVLK